ncbi:MAG TPA: multicopper oxidase domain-containing protein [Saprospiraceae bacterium]|nr:multicopper oxidase domain-containing protein [Saprospiraceae bacterium]
MKLALLIILNLLINLLCYAQHDATSMKMDDYNNEPHLPFYTKIGGRAIYHLYLTDTMVNYTGRKRAAMAINGSIPAPTLTFTEGDTAEIYVHNEMMMETSIHWHGIILPNRYDGVSYLTTAPIKMGQTHYYTFPIVQNGTYWYHSHTMMQQQSGLYGAIVIHKRNEKPIKEYTLLLSDWTDENPEEVDRSLHNATDWYSIKKGSSQSYAEAIKAGFFKTKLTNEWKRMTAMDVSDVYYDRFLSNGKAENAGPALKAGDHIRLRVINGSASTYFWLQFAGGKLTVIANDGKDVEPVKVDRMLIAVSETYDIMLTIPENNSYEFLATAEDRTKSTSLWLGSGSKMKSEPMPRLKYFKGMKMMNDMMKMNGDMDDMGMKMSLQKMDMNMVMYPEMTGDDKAMENMDSGHGMRKMSKDLITLNYAMLLSPIKTNLPDAPVRELHFNLSGNMSRYVWTIDNKQYQKQIRY